MKTAAFGLAALTAALILWIIEQLYLDDFNVDSAFVCSVSATLLLFLGIGLVCFDYRWGRERWEIKEYEEHRRERKERRKAKKKQREGKRD